MPPPAGHRWCPKCGAAVPAGEGGSGKQRTRTADARHAQRAAEERAAEAGARERRPQREEEGVPPNAELV